MLRFFRINDPYRLVFIFIILILIRIGQSFFIADVSFFELKWLLLGEWLGKGFILYDETFDYTGPLAALIYKGIDLIFGRSAFVHHSLNAILLIIQAGIFNQLLLKNKAYDENSYLPAFLYIVLMIAVPDFFSLSPQLLSLTFVLLAFRNVLRRIDNQITDELFLNTGLYIGIATMIYLPTVVYFIVFMLSLILFSTAAIRRLILYFFGFVLVFSLCSLYFFWLDTFDVFWASFVVAGFSIQPMELITIQEFALLGAPILLLLFLSVAKTWTSARLTNFQQKVQQVIWFMFFGGLGIYFLSKENSGAEWVFMVPATAYFWTFYFILIRRRFFKLIMPGILIFGTIGFSLFSYKNLTHPLLAKTARDIEPKTMIIGEDLASYKEQEMFSPCFNHELSLKAMEGLKYHGSAEKVFELFEMSDPEFIIDDLGVVNDLFFRFPPLEKKYLKTTSSTYRKISN